MRSGQNHLARHSERGKKTRQTEEAVGRQHQGMDRPGVCQVPEGNGEQRKMEETDCEVICGAPTTLAVKGQVKVKVKVPTVSIQHRPVTDVVLNMPCSCCRQAGTQSVTSF